VRRKSRANSERRGDAAATARCRSRSAFAHARSRITRVGYRGFQITGRCLIPGDGSVAGMGGVSNGEFAFAFLVAAIAGIGVFFHAERHGIKHASAWASFVFLFLIVGLPAYLFRVRRGRKRTR
jgi:hypothetical protein